MLEPCLCLSSQSEDLAGQIYFLFSDMAERRKSSILVNRKLSTDFARKLSAISVASDVSLISERFGMEQGELRSIVQDILDMNINDDFDVSLMMINFNISFKATNENEPKTFV